MEKTHILLFLKRKVLGVVIQNKREMTLVWNKGNIQTKANLESGDLK